MPELRTVYFTRIDSLVVGPLLLAATAKGLRCVQFYKGKLPPPPAKDETWVESPEYLRPYISELESYFRGELRAFTCKLDLVGTQFQKDCWQALLRIPYGQTCSYADIAAAIGRPNAFRAVGQANHDNPIAIIVPCHRVLGADGTLTGYGGGLSTKEKLLRLEGAKFRLKAKSVANSSTGTAARPAAGKFSILNRFFRLFYPCGGLEPEGGVPLLGSGLAVLPGFSVDVGVDFSFRGLIVSLLTSFLLPV